MRASGAQIQSHPNQELTQVAMCKCCGIQKSHQHICALAVVGIALFIATITAAASVSTAIHEYKRACQSGVCTVISCAPALNSLVCICNVAFSSKGGISIVQTTYDEQCGVLRTRPGWQQGCCYSYIHRALQFGLTSETIILVGSSVAAFIFLWTIWIVVFVAYKCKSAVRVRTVFIDPNVGVFSDEEADEGEASERKLNNVLAKHGANLVKPASSAHIDIKRAKSLPSTDTVAPVDGFFGPATPSPPRDYNVDAFITATYNYKLTEADVVLDSPYRDMFLRAQGVTLSGAR